MRSACGRKPSEQSLQLDLISIGHFHLLKKLHTGSRGSPKVGIVNLQIEKKECNKIDSIAEKAYMESLMGTVNL